MNLPIVAFAILGIVTTSIFLLTYYLFVIKCCLNWRRPDHHPFLRRRRGSNHPFSSADDPVGTLGLDPAAISAIPIFSFSSPVSGMAECAVCLTEFHNGESLRLLPGCTHAFHIDCIDIWLQSNASCPLCRTTISGHFPATAHGLHHPQSVVLDVPNESPPAPATPAQITPAASVTQAKKGRNRKPSMGDEFIEVTRKKDETFAVEPIRRSLSMDSSRDRQLYADVQEILLRNPDLLFREVGSSSNGGGGSGRAWRPFFSFGGGRSWRRALLPVEAEV
ncbi:RING-H2 finger protein ATL16 [Apostasia shenzhenica]|uniref:RING-type E3 ubiquitin transferase n=1 Tax=Apostasia shenzhenica TaxID=1088818 RepID=A0A2H9ZWY8_9ASPA|nr:RING-H2 finger protein ATL16 [Apostasia shenzhenica]